MQTCLQDVITADIEAGSLTQDEAAQIYAQFAEFERRRTEIETSFPGKQAAIAELTLFVDDTWTGLVAQIRAQHPDALFYAECPVGGAFSW